MVSVTDASFANETVITPLGQEQPHRSQKAFMILLVDPDILTKDTAGCHIWAWRSLTDKRVCRATLQGTSYHKSLRSYHLYHLDTATYPIAPSASSTRGEEYAGPQQLGIEELDHVPEEQVNAVAAPLDASQKGIPRS